jgi:ribosomal protein S25
MFGPNKLKLSDKVTKKIMERMEPSSFDGIVVDKENLHLIWIGRYDQYGRPQFHFEGKYVLAKRLMYESWNGPIPDDQIVINTCKNKKCVRPDHLKAGQYFKETTRARNWRKHPVNKRNRCIVVVDERLMLKVLNGIKRGRLNSISEIGEFMNVDDCDVIKFLLNNNWLFINNYYTKDQLDELRAKVMPLVDVGVNQTDFPMRSFIDEYFKSRGCCST